MADKQWHEMAQIERPDDIVKFMDESGMAASFGHIDDSLVFSREIVAKMSDDQIRVIMAARGPRQIGRAIRGVAVTMLSAEAPETVGENRRQARDEMSLNEQFKNI